MDKFFSKSVKQVFTTAMAFFVLSIATSQCFAQSPSRTARQTEDKRYLELINTLYYYIQQNYVEEVDPEILYEGAIKGMLEALDDPYSVYMPKDEWRSLKDTTVGSFGGVGLSITKPTENTPEKPAYVEVAQPIEDSPGARAGIQAGDKIKAINGEDTAPMTMNEVLDKLRGVVGTSV
ncbi:MAG: PDZ domain-containing protein, partial [Treponema sp.]|nr:PDZ domain-containing protein [Treponema sp.]